MTLNNEPTYPRAQDFGDGISIPEMYFLKIAEDLLPVKITKNDYKYFKRKKELKGLIRTSGKPTVEIPKKPDDYSENGGIPSHYTVFRDGTLHASSDLVAQELDDLNNAQKLKGEEVLASQLDDSKPEPIKLNKENEFKLNKQKNIERKIAKNKTYSENEIGALLFRVRKNTYTKDQDFLQAILCETRFGLDSDVRIKRETFQFKYKIKGSDIRPLREKFRELGIIAIKESLNEKKTPVFHYTLLDPYKIEELNNHHRK